MTGIEQIAAERERQGLKWGDAHDDTHTRQEILEMAICYLKVGQWQTRQPLFNNLQIQPWMAAAGIRWPFPGEPFTTGEDGRRNLVIAAALIAAELDRMDRASGRNIGPGPS